MWWQHGTNSEGDNEDFGDEIEDQLEITPNHRNPYNIVTSIWEVMSSPEYRRAIRVYDSYNNGKIVCQQKECLGLNLNTPVGKCRCGIYHLECNDKIRDTENRGKACTKCRESLHKNVKIEEVITIVLKEQFEQLWSFFQAFLTKDQKEQAIFD